MAESVVVIGAGPAGLTAAYFLCEAGLSVTVLESDPTHVGGLARTVSHDGFHFDIGGHRFFSKSAEVEAFWTELLGPNLLQRTRKSRIYYRGRLFDYPLNIGDALKKLGPAELVACTLSYLRQRVAPMRHPRSFEDWVTSRFGRRLFRIFFQTYTEKVWGMKCSEISADWAAQRINNLSLTRAVWHALFPPRDGTVKTLIGSFRYPRRGPGMMWEAAARKVRERGGDIRMGMSAVRLAYDAAAGRWLVVGESSDGRRETVTADHVISSMALKDLVPNLWPEAPPDMRAAAAALRYRDFLVVGLIVEDHAIFDDTWLYIHDPTVKVGRIQNFRAWSPEMVPAAGLNGYGLEYFCTEGDDLWAASDDDIVALARRELVALRLAEPAHIRDGFVIRQKKAYPVYDDAYRGHVAVIREAIETRYPRLHLVGRNGMHKYNNQDHAIMTAMLTVRNILLGRPEYDVWQVNQDAEYLEGAAPGRPILAERLVPKKIAS